MLYSLLIKLALLGLTLSVVLWFGWRVPDSINLGGETTSELGINTEGSTPASARAQDVDTASRLKPQEPLRRPVSPVAERVDLNRATEQDLEALPGIGPVIAERIVEYRATHGAFHDVAQLRHVKGIGKKKFDRIHSLVDVTLPVSTRTSGKTT